MPEHIPTRAEVEALRGLADDWESEDDVDILRERIADLHLVLARLDEAERRMDRIARQITEAIDTGFAPGEPTLTAWRDTLEGFGVDSRA